MPKTIVSIWLATIILVVILVGLGMAQQRKVHIAVVWGGDELDAFEATGSPPPGEG